ncbi:hypothetical protein [Ramlibacter alkalitolerans]|uniref:Uncharacterized protein n=1 Tax=Ramlibacter alkalitolerans TaxID=2039631 RepID=A0ABS1JUC8_9BURK|nr:hypothetical protein [Ramlibacter alkalitolerans]MBL0427869.1 hypothetical protein [Ramlibacter alkalitolerans]
MEELEWLKEHLETVAAPELATGGVVCKLELTQGETTRLHVELGTEPVLRCPVEYHKVFEEESRGVPAVRVTQWLRVHNPALPAQDPQNVFLEAISRLDPETDLGVAQLLHHLFTPEKPWNLNQRPAAERSTQITGEPTPDEASFMLASPTGRQFTGFVLRPEEGDGLRERLDALKDAYRTLAQVDFRTWKLTSYSPQSDGTLSVAFDAREDRRASLVLGIDMQGSVLCAHAVDGLAFQRREESPEAARLPIRERMAAGLKAIQDFRAAEWAQTQTGAAQAATKQKKPRSRDSGR